MKSNKIGHYLTPPPPCVTLSHKEEDSNTLGRIQLRHNKPDDCKMERKIPQQQGGKMDDCQTSELGAMAPFRY